MRDAGGRKMRARSGMLHSLSCASGVKKSSHGARTSSGNTMGNGCGRTTPDSGLRTASPAASLCANIWSSAGISTRQHSAATLKAGAAGLRCTACTRGAAPHQCPTSPAAKKGSGTFAGVVDPKQSPTLTSSLERCSRRRSDARRSIASPVSWPSGCETFAGS
eukprot:1135607-Rhodomonas_salina.1